MSSLNIREQVQFIEFKENANPYVNVLRKNANTVETAHL